MYSRQDVVIKTKITDKETVEKLVKPICDFVDKHDAYFSLGYDSETNRLMASYEVKGKTSAYCKGIVAEIKQMLKEAFNCKIEVLFYAY